MIARARQALLTAAALAAPALPRPRPRGTRPRILVLRPDHLGDLLLATAVLSELRRREPEAEIWALVGPWSAPALAGNPDLDRVLTYPFPWFDRQPLPGPAERYLAAAALATRLRALAFDRALVLRPDHWWGALAVALARIPERVGYGFPGQVPLLTCALPPPPREHAVVTGLRLVGGAAAAAAARPGAPPTRFALGPADRAAGDRLLAAAGLAGHSYALIHPGASSAVKRWPAERWALVADALAAGGRPVLLAAGPTEGGELDALERAAAVRHHRLPGAPSLGELGALLAGADLALGVDSAPMHLATAVGTPTLRLYGPGDEALFGPWGAPARHRALRAAGSAPDASWFGRDDRPHPSLLALEPAAVLGALAGLAR